MATPKNDKALEWGKLIVPILLPLLVGSEIWQYLAAPDKIKADTEAHVEAYALNKLEDRVDSLAKVLVNKEYAKGILTEATADVKGINGAAAKEYLGQVFKVADEAIANDSNWRHVQQPFIKELYKMRKALFMFRDYEPIIPLRRRVDAKDFFNSYEGLVPLFNRQGLVGYSLHGDNKYLQHLSTIEDR